MESVDHTIQSVKQKQSNAVSPEDRPIHNWYRFVLSFPPHLVREYIDDFGLTSEDTILDPFCGTGTTVVESKLRGHKAVGIEANPFPYFASSVKTDWDIDPDTLIDMGETIAQDTQRILSKQGISDGTHCSSVDFSLRTLPEHTTRALIKNSISPLPLHKFLVLRDQIENFQHATEHKHLTLALGTALVTEIGNLKFGPEVGVGKIRDDVFVTEAWLNQIRKMAADLRQVQGRSFPQSQVYMGDARNLVCVLKSQSIDAVITSPPYPNEKDYTRTTRLESVLLGFYKDMGQLRKLKKTLLRSNTRGIYVADEDDKWVSDNQRVQRIADEIERRRIELGKTSGFEKLYSRATKLYFGGMTRHLAMLRNLLKPNAQLAYVVGDQASYLQVLIRTGEILAEIAENLGYEPIRIDLFRTRFATATQTELREEVVVLKWRG